MEQDIGQALIKVSPTALFGIVTAALAIAGAAIRMLEIFVTRKFGNDQESKHVQEAVDKTALGLRNKMGDMIDTAYVRIDEMVSDIHNKIDGHSEKTDERIRKVENKVAVLEDRSKRG